jgi:K(+)-stimulated pyrophosphate-energized sodium pump
MLSTTAIVVAEDTFGPIADNAQGIAEMSGELEGQTEKILDGLDTVGNTTKAVTKGFAIGSAVIAAVALFASFRETVAAEAGRAFESIAINIAEPKTFAGALIGGTVVFLFSSLAILAVGRTAGIIVQEVRTQFREKPGIMDYSEKPDYGAVIDICTGAALRELVTPALLAVLMPVVVGFALGAYALGGYLGATIVVGALMANFLSNAGGAWDNAKKYIEEGNLGGKGSDVHKAVVIGDTVGDPFKDTAGPAINPLIKVMNLISLLILPAVINLSDNDAARYAIAAVALIVILAGVVFSKSQKSAIDAGEAAAMQQADAATV